MNLMNKARLNAGFFFNLKITKFEQMKSSL